MNIETIPNFFQGIAVSEMRFHNFLVAQPFVTIRDISKQPGQRRTPRIALDTRNFFYSLLIIQKYLHTINEFFTSQEYLADKFSPWLVVLHHAISNKVSISLPSSCSLLRKLPQQPISDQIFRWLACCIGCTRITAPLPLFQVRHHIGAYRIENHVAAQFQQVIVLLNKNRFVASLENMTHLLMDKIERML